MVEFRWVYNARWNAEVELEVELELECGRGRTRRERCTTDVGMRTWDVACVSDTLAHGRMCKINVASNEVVQRDTNRGVSLAYGMQLPFMLANASCAI